MKTQALNLEGEMVSSKSLGQYFTPENIAEFMADLIHHDQGSRVLEPCAGEGVFLRTLWNRNYRKITAYEIDQRLPNKSPGIIQYTDFLTTPADEKFDVILGNPPYVRWKNIPKKYKAMFKSDVQWQDKINGLSDLLYPFIFHCIAKLTDGGELIFITPLFWTQTLHAAPLRRFMMRHGEVTHLITFNEMRIFKEASTSIIVFRFVKGHQAEPVKVIHTRSKARLDDASLTQVKAALDCVESGEEYYVRGEIEAYVQPQFDGGTPWKPIPPHIRPLLEKIETGCEEHAPLVKVSKEGRDLNVRFSTLFEKDDLRELNVEDRLHQCVKFYGKKYYSIKKEGALDGKPPHELTRYIRLGDVAEIGNGLVSGLDRAFRVNGDDDFTSTENEKTVPVLKASQLRQYFTEEAIPYIFVNDVQSEGQLKTTYPRIYYHLSKFRSILEDRYSYARDIPWWHWVFLRNINLIRDSREKILTPCKERVDKKGYARFAYAEGLAFATQDVTAIVKKPQFRESTKYLLAVLNSDLIFTWLRYKGLARGGVLEFSERPLTRIPIRLIDWQRREEVELHEQIVKTVNQILRRHTTEPYKAQLEALIRDLYGLESTVQRQVALVPLPQRSCDF